MTKRSRSELLAQLARINQRLEALAARPRWTAEQLADDPDDVVEFLVRGEEVRLVLLARALNEQEAGDLTRHWKQEP